MLDKNYHSVFCLLIKDLILKLLFLRIPFSLTTSTSYRPQRSCGQGNIFTPVCHSVHRGGVCLSACWDTPPSRHSPPGSRLRHTVNERPVRILLECILVQYIVLTDPRGCWGLAPPPMFFFHFHAVFGKNLAKL